MGRDDVAARLAAYADRARTAALDVVGGSGASPYLTEPAAAYLSRGGKGLRPALCLAACEAFGGDPEQALPSAVAIELLHTAFLVHDDVEDGSDLRRGKPTLHRLYGTGLAVNAGDGLLVQALGVLGDNTRRLGPRLASRVWTEFELMARQTVEGQALELGWLRDGRVDLTPEDYLELIMKKTCWYTTLLPLRVGALVGSGGSADLVPLLRFGFFLGAAFQIRDDVLNLRAPDRRYGKEPLGDLREGKRTLMLIHLLAAVDPQTRRHLVDVLCLPPQDRAGAPAEQIADLMEAHGSLAFAEEFARGIARSAGLAFEQAFAGTPDSPARRFLADLVPYMVDRPA